MLIRILTAVAIVLSAVTPVVHADVLHDADFEASGEGYVATGATSWQWGQPAGTPSAAHSPLNCWGTNLAGNYGNNELGALLSPVIDTTAAAGGALLLSWWEWTDYEVGYDHLRLEVTRDSGATWETVYLPSVTAGGGWQYRRIVLTEAAAVPAFRFRFLLQSDVDIAFPGWDVDDLVLRTLDSEVLLSTDRETMGELPDDLALSGSWELGSPDGTVGPSAPHSGNRCLGTNLTGFYGKNETAVCSFSADVPVDTSGTLTLALTWWQWLQLDGYST